MILILFGDTAALQRLADTWPYQIYWACEGGLRRGACVRASEEVMGTFGWWREGGRPGVIRGGRQEGEL